MALRSLAVIVGLTSAALILWDGLDYALLPTRTRSVIRPSRYLTRGLWWRGCRFASRLPEGGTRDTVLNWLGPLSVVTNFVTWAVGLVVAFGLVQWGLESRLHDAFNRADLFDYLYFSGVTFFTLGYGDIVPVTAAGKLISLVEVGTGYSFLAIMISYFPVLTQAYAGREVEVLKLAARAGTPPSGGELILRAGGSLNTDFRDWESWVASVYQSHIAFPMLAFYRSQGPRHSWLAAMTAMLDAAALTLTVVNVPDRRSAQTLFTMVRYFLVELCANYPSRTIDPKHDRVPPTDLVALLARLAQHGIPLNPDPDAPDRFQNLRRTYEPTIQSLARYFAVELPPIHIDDPLNAV